MRIFVSYRREDTSGHAGRLADALASRYGRDHVFIDVDTLRLGSPFADEIARAVSSCDVVIALIGRGWLVAAGPGGGRRLDDPGDYVRLEIETALAAGVVVVPVCVQGARIPGPREVPETLAAMTQRHGFELRDASWRDDVASLVRRLESSAEPTDQSDANKRWSLPLAAKSGLDLIRRLPPLEWEARPGIAALVGSVFGGFGTALYFRTLLDVLIGIVLAVPFVVAASMLPDPDSTSEATMPWWAWAIWGISGAVSGLYCILRAYSSNQQLEGAGRTAELAAEQRDAVLARRIQSLGSHGWRIESQARFEAVVTRSVPNHMLHAILTFVSFGLWAPVWVIVAIQGGEKRRAASVDQWGNLRVRRLERRAGSGRL
jgi:TIR domain-containing protein